MNYEETLKQLQAYYSNLLIMQYNGKPKAKATIELITSLVYSNMILIQIRDGFDWRTAVGPQLDIVGQWVGVSRTYTANASWANTYLSYPNYGTESDAALDIQRGGYSTYSDFDTLEGGVVTYNDLQTYIQKLDDDDYRTIIGLKIIKNSINHTQGPIDDAIALYFAEKDADGNVIFDENGYVANPVVYTTWQPHKVIYHYPLELTTLMNICLSKGVLPAPTGCQIQLTSY